MDISICGTTDDNVFQYMVSHGNSWILHESIIVSNNFQVTSYLASQENVREIIKIEEMLPTSDNDQSFYGDTEDSKDVYTSCGEDYITYESEICSTQFPSKTHPMLHERLQKTEKPYKCDQCDKQFAMKAILKQHQVIHKKEKPFKCDQCGKQFSQSSYLKQHKFIHTGENAFKCDQCDKRFSE